MYVVFQDSVKWEIKEDLRVIVVCGRIRSDKTIQLQHDGHHHTITKLLTPFFFKAISVYRQITLDLNHTALCLTSTTITYITTSFLTHNHTSPQHNEYLNEEWKEGLKEMKEGRTDRKVRERERGKK